MKPPLLAGFLCLLLAAPGWSDRPVFRFSKDIRKVTVEVRADGEKLSPSEFAARIEAEASARRKLTRLLRKWKVKFRFREVRTSVATVEKQAGWIEQDRKYRGRGVARITLELERVPGTPWGKTPEAPEPPPLPAPVERPEPVQAPAALDYSDPAASLETIRGWIRAMEEHPLDEAGQAQLENLRLLEAQFQMLVR